MDNSLESVGPIVQHALTCWLNSGACESTGLAARRRGRGHRDVGGSPGNGAESCGWSR